MMVKKLAIVIDLILSKIGLKIIRLDNYFLLNDSNFMFVKMTKQARFLNTIYPDLLPLTTLFHIQESQSQNNQDLFVLDALKCKRNGYFVEVGAADGIRLSNTYLLEKSFQWRGICVEPSKHWHSDLRKNRNCYVDTRCVFSNSGQKIAFFDAQEHELSTIKKYVDIDMNGPFRKKHSEYTVETVKLTDLLDQYQAPYSIDYISLDTEGSELEILNGFDFNKYEVSVWTVEHNFTENRDLIYEIMEENGYVRILEKFSDFDDWFVKSN